MKPTPAAPGAAGWFSAGNPITGTPATVLAADWLNDLLDNLLKLLEVAGVTPTKGRREDIYDALNALAGVLPLSAQQHPSVQTVDHRIAITGISFTGAGGKLVMPAGVRMSIAQEVVSGGTCRMRTVVTPAYTSVALDASSTYYLRANLAATGVLVPYVQKGTDADAIPGSYKGTAGASAGGGFDSTAIDVLLSKVTTGAAGTVPTVLNLANFWDLYARFSFAGSTTYAGIQTYVLNWARVPSSTWFQSVVGLGLAVNIECLTGMGVANVSRYSIAAEVVGWRNVTSTPNYYSPVYILEVHMAGASKPI